MHTDSSLKAKPRIPGSTIYTASQDTEVIGTTPSSVRYMSCAFGETDKSVFVTDGKRIRQILVKPGSLNSFLWLGKTLISCCSFAPHFTFTKCCVMGVYNFLHLIHTYTYEAIHYNWKWNNYYHYSKVHDTTLTSKKDSVTGSRKEKLLNENVQLSKY